VLELHTDTCSTSYTDRSVLELGCGTGLLGMCLARLSPSKQRPSCVMLTDGDDKALDLLNQNLVQNGFHREGAVAAAKLLWGDTDTDATDCFIDVCQSNLPCRNGGNDDDVEFDCIVAGDVLYKAELPPLFLRTVSRFLSPSGTLWLCHVPRANVSHEGVSSAVRTAGFHIVEQRSASSILELDGAIGEGCPFDDVQRAQIYRISRCSSSR
jgi:protein-lysine N-methyltransferase EEF2KMT